MMLLPQRAPAPIVWRPGEGWSWEHGGVPIGANAKEQLEIGRRFEQEKNWSVAISSYRRLVKKWPTSAFAPEAQYRLGLCLEKKEFYYAALQAYQKALTNYPSTPQFLDILENEFKIGNLFLGGMHHKIWGLKIFPGYDKAVEAYQNVIHNGPYTDLAPQAQFSIGLAYEKQKKWAEAVDAYQKVLDAYYNSKWVDSALFEMGVAHYKQSRSADYDQEAAHRAVDAFSEFATASADDKRRVAEAQNYMTELAQREAEGLYKVAKFYDSKRHNEHAALIYYSELVRLHGNSPFAKRVIPRLEELKAKQPRPSSNTTPNL